MNDNKREQQHPQEKTDRLVVDRLLQEEPDDLNLAECARLRIRYKGFQGAYALQKDLDRILEKWGLSEEELFARTRAIHSQKSVYRVQAGDEDWS